MSKLRSINTKFWDDPFIVKLSLTEKLLFLYLITNSLTNLLGVYEISLRKISFDTGINQNTVRKGLERFEKVRKVFYIDSFIILPNFLKNQKLNKNMKIAVEKEFDLLPDGLKTNLLDNGSETVRNGYQTILNGMQKIRKEEDESKDEVEDQDEEKIDKSKFKNFEQVVSFFDSKFYKEQKWLDAYDKLIRLDNYSEDRILEIVKEFRSDGNWWKDNGNFETLIKLRQKNKDDIKYIELFEKKMNKSKINDYDPASLFSEKD
jgi:uncharacterized UPF0160 family protein